MRITLALCATLLTTALAGCTGGPMPAENLAETNPVAVYCIQTGGDFIIDRRIDGSGRGLCVLPSGERVDAVKFYLDNNPGVAG